MAAVANAPAGQQGLAVLQEEFHFHTSQFDDIVVVELMCLSIERFAVDDRKMRALNVRDEITVRPARNYCHLHARFSQRRQILY